MRLASALSGSLLRATDAMTECGTEPIQTMGFALDRIAGRALNRLEQFEATLERVLFPALAQQRSGNRETLTAAPAALWDADVPKAPTRGPVAPMRHLRSV